MIDPGLLRNELFVGLVISISARSVGVNLGNAGRPSGSHFQGKRYGRGEVGEFVLVEGQQNLILGRMTEVRLPDSERKGIKGWEISPELDAIGLIHVLGSVAMDTLFVSAGVEYYPRLGDRVYSAPHGFLAQLPSLMELPSSEQAEVQLELGTVGGIRSASIMVRPERLFGRHCAVLGSTGGGKSWTTARIMQECLRFQSKVILIDATGEYRGISGTDVLHSHLGNPVRVASQSQACSLPPTCFVETDFLALFEPAGKVQGPKLRAAIRSLRLANLHPHLAANGVILKHNMPKRPIADAELEPETAKKLDDPTSPFEVTRLLEQISQECVWPNGGTQRDPDHSRYGGPDESSYSNCLSLLSRISGALTSPALACVFQDDAPNLVDQIISFFNGPSKMLRICLSGMSFEYRAREVVANAIGRQLLNLSRTLTFQTKPLLVVVDEAHNFLGKTIGGEDTVARLDSFELVAKEGRKFGLNLCLSTQRPRDITEGVLSQMGTLIVHRLTNDRDREVVERACGEIDKAASAFLPNLRPGEAAIIGADFPIPLTMKVIEPATKPFSDGPRYQSAWANPQVRGQ